jgi:hypothetical protein
VAFQLPRLSLAVPVAGDLKPTTVFQRWWQSVCEAIEKQEEAQDTILSQIQASFVQAGQGVVATDAGAGTAKSGQDTDTGLTVDSAAWVNGPLVPLTGVTAPMSHLTLTGSGPQSGASTGGPMDGEYRVQEIVGAIETTVFTGHFTARTTVGGTTLISLSDPVNTQIFVRAATGAVSYRLDIRRTAGAGIVESLQAYLFARRAP